MDAPKHESDNVGSHLCLAMDIMAGLKENSVTMCNSYAQLGQQKLVELDAQIKEATGHADEVKGYAGEKIAELDTLITKVTSLSLDLEGQVWGMQFTKRQSGIIRVTNCQKNMASGRVFVSKPFFASPGYCTYFATIHVGFRGGPESDCVSIHTSLVKGQFDASISWPFVGQIGFMLLNQISNDDHCYRVLSIAKEDNMRVGSPPVGFADFVPCRDLHYHPGVNKQQDAEEEDGATASSNGVGVSASDHGPRQFLLKDSLLVLMLIDEHKSWLKCSEC
jgi:hypothetical protein